MQKHPMLSVREAADLLGCDERWVREKLYNGSMKGEKKTVGMRDKWFVYKGEVDAVLAQKRSFTEAPGSSTIEVEERTVEAESEVQDFSPSMAWIEEERQRVRMLAEEMMQPLLETIRQQERELQSKDAQLRLLPDLQKQAEQQEKEASLKHVENEALKKQIEAMAQEKKAAEAVIAQMMDDIEKLKTPWWRRMFSAQKEA